MSITKKKKASAQRKIAETIRDRGLKQSWVAAKAGISTPHLSNILAERVLLTQENLDKINQVLETDYTL